MASNRFPYFGAFPEADGTRFRLWASKHKQVDLILFPERHVHAMTAVGDGVFEAFIPGVKAGARYKYRLDGVDTFPDPASRFQPEGVHGPSMVVDPNAYRWADQHWPGVRPEDLVFYELHVGTFTPEGTFDGVRDRLLHLKQLGITALELMPVADFPGDRSWGYDQAALFAPARAYGTPDELRALVEAAHGMGMAVFLDVIYNHLGPDGAYAAAFGHYFTRKHHTPWGLAVNLDDEHAEQVRTFFIDNALYWLREFHLDGLRLDATDALKDDSPKHFLRELAEAVQTLEGPPRHLIAEDHRNLNTVIRTHEEDGYGMAGVWADNFHHQMRNYLAGDCEGYFADCANTTSADIVTTLRQGWFFTGQFLDRIKSHRGTPTDGLPPHRFVLCIQNHDQIGNRPRGDRLTETVSPAAYRAASALLLFAPQTPLLFMGQEWGATTPFQFFTDHNEELGELVRIGRKEEFRHFSGFQALEVPDPQSPDTFERSKLDWDEVNREPHAQIFRLYRDLLALRRTIEGPLEVESPIEGGLVLARGRHHLLVALRDGVRLPRPAGAKPVLHTEDPAYAEDGDAPALGETEVFFPVPAALVFARD